MRQWMKHVSIISHRSRICLMYRFIKFLISYLGQLMMGLSLYIVIGFANSENLKSNPRIEYGISPKIKSGPHSTIEPFGCGHKDLSNICNRLNEYI